MKLCEDCRDPHTVAWLNDYVFAPDLVEEYGGGTTIFDYGLLRDGTGSKFLEEHFQGRWDLPLLKLTQRSTDTMIISSKRRGRGSRRVGRKITLICKNGGSKLP